jgi:T5SS/PEP-CTERM-associated repeat protein
MSLSRTQLDRLHALTAALLEDTISPAEFDQLATWLRFDQDAREFFVTYVDLHCLLRRQGVARSGKSAKQIFWLPCGGDVQSTSAERDGQSAGFEATASRKAARLAPLSLGSVSARLLLRPVPLALSMVLILISAPLLALGFWAASMRVAEPPPKVVARLTAVRDVRWRDETVAPLSQSLLVEGQHLELLGGFAEVTFDLGPKVLLKGPAKFCVWSSDCGRLQNGELTTQIPSAAVGFRIATPSVDVVGLGAEFGVAVDAAGIAEVHALEGGVAAVFNDVVGDGPARRIDLEQSEAVRFVAGEKSADRFTASPDRFQGMASVDEPPENGRFWTAEAGNWADPKNWTPTTLPGTAGHVGIANGGRVVVDSAVDADFLSLGWTRGPFTGESSSGHAEIITGGSLLVRRREAYVGVRKSDLFTTLKIAGGTLRVNSGGYLMIADEAGSKGKATIESGFLRLDDGGLWIGVQGTGELGVSGGVVSVGRSVHIAEEASSTGRLAVTGSGAKIDVGEVLTIGKNGQAELVYVLDSQGASPISVGKQVEIAKGAGKASLKISLSDPAPPKDIVLISTLSERPLIGNRFAGLPDESPVTALLNGKAWNWLLSYDYDSKTGVDGSGNDVALKFVRVESATQSED